MKILVTGGAGYIGSHTVGQLLKQGYEVIVYDNLSRGFQNSFPSERVRFVLGDVRDAFLLQRVMKDIKPAAVLHFAAKLVVPESIEQPLEYYENNVQGVVNLLKACQMAQVSKLVFSSTAAVYGDSNRDGSKNFPAGVVHETTPLEPLNPYGSSKMFAERVIQDAERAQDLKSVIFRYFNVAGAAADGSNGQRTDRATQLIKVVAEAAAGRREFVEIYGTDYPTKDGTCIRDYIHVEDLADLHVLGLKYLLEGGSSQVLNCGYGEGASVREVINSMKKVSGVDFKVKEVSRRQGDAAMSIANVDRLKALFQWTPRFQNLDTICEHSYNWEKSN